MLERMWRKENTPAMWTSLVAQTLPWWPTMRVTQVQSLGREDLLEKEMAAHSSILAWNIPWTEEPGRLQSRCCKESDILSGFTFTFIYPHPNPGSL